MAEHQFIAFNKLLLDKSNPRLSEFGLPSSATQDEILETLWIEMDIKELMYSIVSSGFWTYEPLIGIKSNGKIVIIEGNRRLAAISLLRNPDRIEINLPSHIIDQRTEQLISQLDTIPVNIVESREAAWKHIGFKHVNGPAKWGSFAKAKYIADIHNTFSVPIKRIAYQIGDTHNTAQKLYQGLMVLEQANSIGVYKYDDIQSNRIYFSHLYTGIQREGIRKYLSIGNVEEESKNPVPENKHKELGQLLEWLFGSKKNDTQPIIKSQNPDLKLLDEVLQSKEATYSLTTGDSLIYAHELSRASSSIFEESLLAAKKYLHKAKSHSTTGYSGDEALLRTAGSVADMAEDLYLEMEKRLNKPMRRTKPPRLSE